jgi:hypothetical protein
MRPVVCGLILVLSTAGCAARSTTASRGAPQADTAWGEADRVAVLRQYVERLPVGGRVRVQTVDGERWSATLLSADDQRVVLQPRGRLAEPVRAIPIASLQLIEPDTHNGNNHLVKAVAVGVATGAATFFTMLMIAFATLD